MIKNKKTAFTLMETLITVVILGIVAAILVPSLIKNQVENANRTKVKKAMAAYEKAINFIILENDIKSTEKLKEFGEEENCKFSKAYFKTVQDGTNDCIFKTADRVWWDIADLTNPLISLKDEITVSNEGTIAANALNLNADKTSFALIGRFDDLGTLRVNDNAFEQAQKNNAANQKYVRKLWYFITQSDSVLNEFDKCSLNNQSTCTITKNGISTTYTRIITDDDTTININGCIYDRETKSRNCGNQVLKAMLGEYWISDNLGVPTMEEAKSEETCSSSIYGIGCLRNGDYYEAARIKCEKSGGRLATLAELEIARQNGKLTSGTFWAYEEYGNSYGRIMDSEGHIPTEYMAKYKSEYQIICVGNN